GTMKVRLGFTSPMTLADKNQAVLILPRFLERNFQVACTHSTWIESHRQLVASTESLLVEHPKADLYGVRGQLPHLKLESGLAVEAKRSPALMTAWTEDPLTKGQDAVVQTFRSSSPAKPQRLIVVVDGSSSMADNKAAIVDALNQNLRFLPEDTDSSL